MIDLEKFKESCQKKRCLRNTMITPQCPKEYKQEQCYNKFIQKQERDQVKRQEKFEKQKHKEIEVDVKWQKLKEEITIRDKCQCRFFSIMTEEEKKLIRPHLWGDFKRIDGAHVMSRSSSPHMKYDVDNVYSLYRYIHKSLDELFDPFTRKPISKEEASNYWKRIIGEDKYNELEQRSKR